MKKLFRSRKNSMIAGVCGGIADYLGVDATVIRVVYVLLSLLTAAFPGLVVYIIMLFIIPSEQ
ncbi:PspC domain-containing protein [Effusibacillus consociatus]|uniref:PspC domain-containing protein n=1 Tax=Effusibacillus consociatus TaxID=1117041 RepID=A0ABV9Q2E4_9BACL